MAKTFKGFKFPGISDQDNWHGKPLGDKAQEVILAIQQQIKTLSTPVSVTAPVEDAPLVDIGNIHLSSPPAYKMGELVATRLAYGTALQKLAENNSRVIALDGDTKNSTYSEKIKKVSRLNRLSSMFQQKRIIQALLHSSRFHLSDTMLPV